MKISLPGPVASFDLFFAALVLVVFSSVLWVGALLAPVDGLSYFLPAFGLPGLAWDPYLFSGFPSVGDPQAMLCYPPARILAVFPGSWNVLVLLAYMVAAHFMFLFVRALTGSVWAAAMSAVTFGLGGFLVSHLGQINVVHTAAWTPAALLGLERMRRDPSPRWILLVGLATAFSALAGHPQMLLYSLLVLVPYAVVMRPEQPAPWAPHVARALGALLLGLGIAGIMLVPARELALASVRSSITTEDFLSYSLPARQWSQLLVPYAFGGDAVPYHGKWFLWEITGYPGLAALVFAITAVLSIRRAITGLFALLAAVSLLLALGPATPLGPLTHDVPVLGLFRVLGRHLFEFSLSVSILAGLGLAEMLHAEPERRRRARRIALAVSLPLVALALGAAVASAAKVEGAGLPDMIRRLSVWPQLLHLVLAGGAVLAAGRWRGGGAACLAVATIDLVAFGSGQEWHRDPVRREQLAEPASLAHYRPLLEEGAHRWTPVLGVYSPPECAPPNRSRLWRLESTSGYNPLRLRRYAEFLDLDLEGRPSWAALEASHLGLDLLSARVIAVKSTPEESVQHLAGQQRWALLGATPDATFFENRTVLPRAWTVRAVQLLAPPQILSAVRTGSLPGGTRFDPLEVALVEDADAAASAPPVTETAPSRGLEVVRVQPGRIEYRMDPGPATWAVLSEVHDRGWRARADGRAIPVYRCDYTLCGVVLPAGARTLELRFEPTSLRAGMTMSLVSLAGLGLLATGRRRRSMTGSAIIRGSGGA